MPPSPELVARSGDLKRTLVEFAGTRRFARQMDEAVWRYLDETGADDEGTLINATDHFILQHRLPDGRTVVEVFVEQHPELSEEERALLLSWRDVVEGIFEVEQRDGDALVTTNLIDELTYRIHSNIGPAIFERMPPRSFVLTRVVPLADEWMLSGSSSLFPASGRDEVYRAAAEAAQLSPRKVFRNPDKLAQGWELQRRERQHFIDFFGSDLVILPGHEVQARLQAFRDYEVHEVRNAEGKTAADHAREKYGVEPPELDYELPPAITEADTVGVIYDEVDGMSFWPDFGLLDEAFANPDLVARAKHRRAVLGYLDSPGVSPVPLRRLAERDPERASRVFAQVLKRPTFSWERDGDPLLRDRKASYFEQPPIPSVIPVGDRLTQASLDDGKRETRRPGRRSRASGQRSGQHRAQRRSSRPRKQR